MKALYGESEKEKNETCTKNKEGSTSPTGGEKDLPPCFFKVAHKETHFIKISHNEKAGNESTPETNTAEKNKTHEKEINTKKTRRTFSAKTKKETGNEKKHETNSSDKKSTPEKTHGKIPYTREEN